ncbi:MAG: PDZ domain-containing protein, partial [Allobaculum sp.]|nr:PDZ domain-containing protein [Allobaculum sp.]
LGGTVTTGIISAVGREITIENETMTLLQTDAAINPGNSGGGLFDINGDLIGVVNAKQSDTGIEGLGFAIPISDVTSVIEDLKTSGRVTSRPVLNVSLQQIGNSYYGFGGSTAPGLYIAQIVEGGTADQAGLEVGDQIIAFDGEEVSDAAEVKKLLREHHIGDVVTMTIIRNGQQQDVQVTLQGDTNNS